MSVQDGRDETCPASGSASPGHGADLDVTRSAPRSFGDAPGIGDPEPRSPSARLPASISQRIRDPQRYTVVAEHGRGGLGSVSRARDHELGRDVAIKELIARGPLSEIRFLREALITARLEHPGIVPIYEAGRWPDGTPFYAMKLVAGRPLRDLIASMPTVAERIGLLHHVIAVADAIAYAHDRNIIHRDLKPANVIVGDFGETIVIDWGLAKDLSTSDDAVPSSPDAPSDPSSDLTRTGIILGTPTYMAPEQERGERVDQRADVFAIGAMLWQLCSLNKVPPLDHALRRRELRNADIDDDLGAIIEKALDPDPARRYENAGLLAADLKAFKSGARISARRYSLVAVLAHWVRRHRAWSLAVLAAAVVLVAGGAVYVRNISIERDRADLARGEAEAAKVAVMTAQRTTAASLAEQVLKRVELLLATDPSAAMDVLAEYRGNDAVAVNILRARARGLGLARLRATPHADLIFWVHGLPNGSVGTLAADGTVAVTDAHGGSRVITRDVLNKDTTAYSEQRSLLAYACHEDDVCLVDFSLADPRVVARFGHCHPDGLGFSADGAQLAAVSHDGYVVVWEISAPAHPVETRRVKASGWNVGFLDASTLAIVDTDHVTIASERGAERRSPVAGVMTKDLSPATRSLALGTTAGVAVLLDAAGEVRARMKLCSGVVDAIRFLPDPRRLAYGCQDGGIGIWDPGSSRVQALGPVRGSAEMVVPDPSGRYLAAGGSAGVLSIFDLESGTSTSYLGHGVRVSTLSVPDDRYPYFTSVDANGVLRVWSRPVAFARVAYTASTRAMDAQLLWDSSSTLSTSGASSLHLQDGPRSLDLGPHEPAARHLVRAPDGDHVAAFGWGGKLELWSTRDRKRVALVETAQTDTTQLVFASATEVVFGGNDGRILRWGLTQGLSTVATLGQPIESFAALPDGQLAVALQDGALKLVTLDGVVRDVAAAQLGGAWMVQASADGRWLATGDRKGAVVVYRTDDWRGAKVMQAGGAIQRLAFSPDAGELVVAAKNNVVAIARFESRSRRDWTRDAPGTTSFSIPARALAFTPTGDLLMVSGADGAMWARSTLTGRWAYVAIGPAHLTVVCSSDDGQRAVSADTAGRVTVFDLAALRKRLHVTTQEDEEP